LIIDFTTVLNLLRMRQFRRLNINTGGLAAVHVQCGSKIKINLKGGIKDV